MPNSLIQVVVALLIIGAILFFAAPYIPGPIMTMIFAVLAIGLLLWLLRSLGWIGGGPPL